MLDDIAVITRPGAASRRQETTGVEEWLKHRMLLARIEAPGSMDGGDVLAVGRRIFVGATSRSNADALEQFRRIVHVIEHPARDADVEPCAG